MFPYYCSGMLILEWIPKNTLKCLKVLNSTCWTLGFWSRAASAKRSGAKRIIANWTRGTCGTPTWRSSQRCPAIRQNRNMSWPRAYLRMRRKNMTRKSMTKSQALFPPALSVNSDKWSLQLRNYIHPPSFRAGVIFQIFEDNSCSWEPSTSSTASVSFVWTFCSLQIFWSS